MAAAKVSAQVSVDLRTQAAYTIRLGKSIQHGSKQRYAAVRYNHKPRIAHPEDATLSIVPEKKPGHTMMSLKDGEEEYEYHGRSAKETDAFVLVRDDKSDGYVLERLVASHTYNLSSAPWETSGKKLAHQYPQLDVSEADQELEDGTDVLLEDSGEVDPENPFDFRNHVSAAEVPSPAVGHPQRSSIGTPATISQAASRQGTPNVRPIKKPTTAFPAQQQQQQTQRKPKPQLPKSSSEIRKGAAASPEPTQRVPTINLERQVTLNKASDQGSSARKSTSKAMPKRKASVQDISFDMDGAGDLVLDTADSHPSAHGPSKRSLGLALTGQLGGGPVSLRSAASSPGSRRNSPAPIGLSGLRRRHGDEDESEEADEDRHDRTHVRTHTDDDVNMHDADYDEDVEDLALPSPAQAQMHGHSIGGSVVHADDDDELEKQMLMAMEEEDPDEGAGQGVAPHDEEEESEEE